MAIDLTALGDRAFRLLLLSQIGSVAGEQIFAVAITVSVLNAGGDASTVGLVLATRGVALVVLLPAGGVWADRVSRRRVLMAANTAAGLSAAGLGLIPARIPVPLLAAAIFVSGATEAFIRPAFSALLQGVLTEDRRTSGRAIISVAVRTGVIAGPGLCAAILAIAGPRPAFGATTLTCLLSVVLFRRVTEPPRIPAHRRSMVRDLRTGLSAALERPWVLAIMIFSTVSLMFVIAPSQVLLPVVSRQRFHSDAVYGTALVCYGVGGLAGGLVAMARRLRSPGRTAMLAMAVYALVPLMLLYSGRSWPLFAGYLLAGAGVETYAIQWDVALQREIPSHLIGRISSLAWLTSFGLMPFGQALTGSLADLTGIAAVLWPAAALALVVPPCLLLVPGMTGLHDPPENAPR